MNKKILYSIIAFIIIGALWLWQQSRITFSVIIPVYNAEKYLEKCLDSVFAQSDSFKVIAVNDGSTDKSSEILQRYAKKHSNMIIINQKNQGVSAARNSALKVVDTDYITFIDSDDWFEKDAFKRVLSLIKKDHPDIVLTGLYDVYNQEWVRQTRGEAATLEVPEESKFPSRRLDKISLFSPFYANNAHSDLFYTGTGIRGQFFRTDFIKKSNLDFPLLTKCGEDDVFVYRSFLHNPLISVLSAPIYNYLNRVDSLAKSQNILSENRKTLAKLQQFPDYQSAPRRVQMLINDAWLSWTLLGIANLQRHGEPWGAGAVEAYEAAQSFNIYNTQELKACRNLPKLLDFLKEVRFNQPL